MDMPGQGGPTGWNNPMKPVGPKKVTQEMIWSSKQFRMLCEMGCSKADAEAALKNTNLNLEDALDMLKSHNRLPVPSPWSDPPIGGPPGNDFPNNPYNNKAPNSFRGPNLGPTGPGPYGQNQDMLSGSHPNLQGNQNMPNNFNQLPLMGGKQPNGLPPGPNNAGLTAPVGPPSRSYRCATTSWWP
jgi:trinucleotide repeat-containing gene 6 protein